MRPRSSSREREWKSFSRALARMGRILQARKTRTGGYAPKQERRDPLLEIVLGSPSISSAIGAVVVSAVEQKGVLSWADVSRSASGATLRIRHKGTHERCSQALNAAIELMRKAGKRVPYYDLIRDESQNWYLAILRVIDPAPVRSFAR